jgi:hypothetical protein
MSSYCHIADQLSGQCEFRFSGSTRYRMGIDGYTRLPDGYRHGYTPGYSWV